MKLSVQVGPYLLTIGFEPFDFVRIKSCGAWALFFGIGSLGYWPWTHGFRIRLGDWTESQALAEGKYTIELCLPGGPGKGIEGVITSDNDLTAARNLYRHAAVANPGRVVLLCEGECILARSDRADTTPD
jgi:hypothetical protein